MNSRHHPSPSLLEALATGTLDMAPGITVLVHVETCDLCRLRVESYERAEGWVLETSKPEPMAADALARTLAQLGAPTPDDDLGPKLERVADITLPHAVARAGLGRRRWLAPGLWAAPVRAPRENGWRTFLLRVPPKMTVPPHGHGGGELIAVWDGAFQNGDGYAAGDFFLEDVAGPDHQLRVTSPERCVCVISVQGRIRWRGLAKMITPILGV